MDNYLWIIPFAPLVGAIINGKLSGLTAYREKGISEKLISFVGCVAPLTSFVVAAVLFVDMLGHDPEHRTYQQTLFDWMVAGPINIKWAYWIDQLSMVMVLVVTGVGTIIHFYSIGYMHGDRGFARYFAYLNLFMFSMLTLVMGQNLPMLFVGWEGVGLCSYLLIGFWYKDLVNAAAGKKAFIVNRIGDLAFLIGMFILFATTAKVGYATLDVQIMKAMVAQHPEVFAGIATATCILLFVGACGKSAQIPLYVWLPDAMAGPTPGTRAGGDGGGSHRGRGDGHIRGHHRILPARHQESPRLLDCKPAGLHVHRCGGGRVFRGHLSPDDARVLQGLPVSRCRVGHSRDERGTGHVQNGGAVESAEGDDGDVFHRVAGDCGRTGAVRFLLQRRDPMVRV
jgi:hypothetical protein